ncbi:MAG: pilin [Patescibacteria group bacterium]
MKNIKKNLLSFLLLSIFSLALLTSVGPAQADQRLLNSQVGLNSIGATAYGGKTPSDIRITIARIINVVLTFLGIIFFGFMIFAGFKYMTAGGNEEKTKEALEMIRNAFIGLIVVLLAWAITRYSIIILGQAAGNAVDYRFYPIE